MINIPNRRIEIITETNEHGCQLVVSHKPDEFGHVQVRINGTIHPLHRYIYEKTYGALEKNLVVRHKCDNPNCVNIEHLESGTHFDNVQDRVNRGRSAKGENNGRAKLTEDDVRFIKNNLSQSNAELARIFNIDRSAVRQIRIGKTWKHVS